MSKKLYKDMSVEEMKNKISENRSLIMSMIVQKNAGTLKATAKIALLRKEIARMLTQINLVKVEKKK